MSPEITPIGLTLLVLNASVLVRLGAVVSPFGFGHF
jgi:hypothetical protein